MKRIFLIILLLGAAALPMAAQETVTPGVLPRTWDSMKPFEQYLMGRNLFPIPSVLAVSLTPSADYAIEVTLKNATDQACTLRYVPGEGAATIDKNNRMATIMLGSKYASLKPQKIYRDLYEDLFSCLEMVLKKIEDVKISGAYQLESQKILDRTTLVGDAYLPAINLSFDDRFYQSAVQSKTDPLLIADAPSIKVDFNTGAGLVWRKTRLWIDDKEYSAAKGDFTQMAIKPYRDVNPFEVDYAMFLLTISVNQKLAFGEHKIRFEIEDAFGRLAIKEAFTRVVTVPAQIIGKTVVFPNPFSPEQGDGAKIQYQLTIPANIDMVIFQGDGSVILKRSFPAGEEGGRKGYNRVIWDGKSEGGISVSNGIYLGAIIDRGENRILDKFRVTVYRR